MKSWEHYPWPEWVPIEVRQEIERFWSPQWHRGLEDWHENNATLYNRHPPIGTRVQCQAVLSEKIYIGRWVPAWNNIGRVIFPDGTYAISSTCCLKVIGLGWGKSLRGLAAAAPAT